MRRMVLPDPDSRETRKQEALEARRRVSRNAALEAATRLFAANGFHETPMADIAREAGISLKALYGSYGSKDDLFVAVLDDSFARLLPALAEDAPAADPGERILELIDTLFAQVDENRDAFLLYARGSDGVPAALTAEGGDPYEPYARLIRERIAALVVTAQDAGYAAGVPADVVAQSIVATMLAVTRDQVRDNPGEPIAKAAPGVRALFAPLFT